jgi:hypothetical protein
LKGTSSIAIAVLGAADNARGFQPAIGNWQSAILMGGPQQMSINVSRWKK